MSHQLRFFFSYGVDTPLWPDGADGRADLDSPHGYPCDPAVLPVTEATAHALTHLADRYQSSLDWDDPGGPSPWTTDRWRSFQQESDAALHALRTDLGAGWTVTDRRT
ncbi:hypothetical protein ACSMX9_13205 [Streptomyces sp. LE64]|uniref:hypothetical protein n=1 Tax=Streptomyces sp. LE64 TaxID=3448653 RepID=UPI004041BE58